MHGVRDADTAPDANINTDGGQLHRAPLVFLRDDGASELPVLQAPLHGHPPVPALPLPVDSATGELGELFPPGVRPGLRRRFARCGRGSATVVQDEVDRVESASGDEVTATVEAAGGAGTPGSPNYMHHAVNVAVLDWNTAATFAWLEVRG